MADLVPGSELLPLLLTAGFALAMLLQHLLSWATRRGSRLHLWAWVWAAGVVLWSLGRLLSHTGFPTGPEHARRWADVSVVALLPAGFGLLGVLGTARRNLLPRTFGAVATVGCLGGAVAYLGLAQLLPAQLVMRTGLLGRDLVMLQPRQSAVIVGLTTLLAFAAVAALLVWRQSLEAYLKALVLGGVLVWLVCLGNELLMGSGLLVSMQLSPYGFLLLAFVITAAAGRDGRIQGDELAKVLGAHKENQGAQNRLLAEALANARDAGRARQRFLARMSHELRTPLAGVMGMTELALDTELDETQRHYLEQASRSAEQLLVLVDDLLDLSRLEAGKAVLAEENFAVRPVLEGALRTVAAQAAEKGVELVLDLPDDLPPALLGDPVRLRQVLVNLLGNAVKFTEEGQITLAMRATVVHHDRLGVRFEVRDTGPGIPADEHERILEPFGQGRLGEGRGTGLGLAICKELVRLQGGTLEMHSKVGEGTTFAFKVMLGMSDAADDITLIDPIELQGLRVLVAEDNDVAAELILRELSGWRVLAERVSDGAQALALLERALADGRPFPLMLLDADMPHTDGWAVMEQLVRRPTLVGATVFMLPAGAPAERFRRSRDLGASSTLCKPLLSAELLQSVLAAIGSTSNDKGQVIDSRPTHDLELRVLAADDQAVNRELIERTLIALGVETVVVGGGAEAVAQAKGGGFDLVLLDVRMPGIDGAEATRQIRAHEAARRRPRVPIVALTAHAMPGDRDRLLAAGMDGYLTKPLRREALRELLDRYRVGDGLIEAPDSVEVPDSVSDFDAPLTRPSQVDAAIDREQLAELTGHDVALQHDLGELMLRELPRYRDKLEQAFEAGDVRTVHRAAHALRGASGNIGARDVSRWAASIELAAASGDLPLARLDYPQLLAEITRLEAALLRLVEER